MALDFPASPTLNQIYIYGNKTWQYNGTGWKSISTYPVMSTTGVIVNSGTSTSPILGISGGTSGQILTSNGSGQASFKDIPVSIHPMFIIGGV